MFKANHSHLVITQYEHLKLAGTLALLWGNEGFEKPPCDFDSFVKGIALHDRGYGVFDALIIGEVNDEEWLDVSRKSFYEEYEDALADIIMKLHVLRLVVTTSRDYSEISGLIKEMQAEIAKKVQENHFDEKLLSFIDRITDLCDRISFDFCFQNYGSAKVKIQKSFSSDELTEVEYHIEEDRIRIAPWPLAVDSYKGYIVGYDSEEFPKKLEPKIVTFCLGKEV